MLILYSPDQSFHQGTDAIGGDVQGFRGFRVRQKWVASQIARQRKHPRWTSEAEKPGAQMGPLYKA